MKIIDLIPYGHENAVTYKWLMRLTGMSKRAVRDNLNQTKKEYMILNMQVDEFRDEFYKNYL